MNIFNRFIIVLLVLALIVVLTVVMVFPGQILPVIGQFLLDWGQYFTWMDQENPFLRLGIGIGLAAIADLILAVLIFLEVKPKRKLFIKVEQVSGGTAMVSLDSITRQLLYRLDPLAGVVKVTPVVHPKGDKIQASVDVLVTREMAVPQMAGQLISTATQALVDDLGLVIAGEPQIRIKVVDGMQQDFPPSPKPTVPAASVAVPPPVLVTAPTAEEPRPILDRAGAVVPEKDKDGWA